MISGLNRLVFKPPLYDAVYTADLPETYVHLHKQYLLAGWL